MSVLGLSACEPPSTPRAAGEESVSETAIPWSSEPVGGFHIVDCQFPGRTIRLPGGTPILMPGRISRTTIGDCRDNLGRYVVYTPSNFEKLLAIWLPNALDGDAEAQTYVGDLHFEGIDGMPDYAVAAKWFQRAVDQDYAPAMVKLSEHYEKGLGVERDRSRAVALLEAGTGRKLIEAMSPDEAGETDAGTDEADRTRLDDPAARDWIERRLEERVAEINTKEEALAQREGPPQEGSCRARSETK